METRTEGRLIRQGRHTELTIGRANSQILICAKSGQGKTLATEKLVEAYHKKGYLVLIMEDIKDEFEFGYAMFEPRAKYHLDLLEKYNIKPNKKQVKIYHPFTFNIPKKKQLPDINFFTIPIKELGREEFSMLLEERRDSSSINLLVNNMERMNKQDGLWDFIHLIRDSVKVEGKFIGKRKIMPIRSGFWTDTPETGTKTNLSEIESKFKPFLHNLFLTPEEFNLNLDLKKIFQDQESYHFFTTKWIKDPKIRYFVIFALFNLFYKYRDECKHPVLFVFEEVRKLVPYESEGYKAFMAEILRDRLSEIRNKGKGGCSTIMNTQVYSDVSLKVRDSATQTFFGNLGSVDDIRKICKALDYGADIKEYLNTMGLMEFIVKGEEYVSTNPVFRILPPSHCHAEEEYDFFEEYRKNYRDKMKLYANLIEEMEGYKRNENRKWKKISIEKRKKVIADHRARIEKKKQAEQEKQQLESIKQETKLKSGYDKERLMPLIIEDRKTMSYRQLAKKYNIPKSTLIVWLKSLDKPKET